MNKILSDLLSGLVKKLFGGINSSEVEKAAVDAVGEAVRETLTEKPTTPAPTPAPVAAPVQNVAPAVEPTPAPVAPWPNAMNFVSVNVAPLQDSDYLIYSHLLGVEPAAIRTVTQVETSGGAFLSSHKPKILFEATVFHHLTSGRFDASNPNISSPTWNRGLYRGGEGEYERLAEAMNLDLDAALQAASWGLFQILGENYKLCGFNNVQDFVKAHVSGEAAQLAAFAQFIKSRKLDVFLRNKDWTSFAKAYNGPGYAQNQYDIKLAEAYTKLTSGK